MKAIGLVTVRPATDRQTGAQLVRDDGSKVINHEIEGVTFSLAQGVPPIPGNGEYELLMRHGWGGGGDTGKKRYVFHQCMAWRDTFTGQSSGG